MYPCATTISRGKIDRPLSEAERPHGSTRTERIATAEAERNAAATDVAAIGARPKADDAIPSPAAVRAYVEALDRVLTADLGRGREFLGGHVAVAGTRS